MKKLDKLIIKAFIGPFVATFFITLFVLIMQFFWLWIDDFVGKGLDAPTIMKFIWYQSAVLIPLALPLSVLLSSLMTFGNLGESFELVAIKSAGISLLRFMRPLFVVAAIISLGAFLFANYVIPVANLKSRTLLGDIVLAKPAFAIKEGVFFDGIDKFAIKVGKKEANDSVIRDVIVFQDAGNELQDNFLIAKNGVMKPSADKRFLDVIFKNGWQYQERGSKRDSITDFIRLGFKEYKMQMDISSFSFKKSDDSANVNNEKMYNMRQLNVAIDSMNKFNSLTKTNFRDNIYYEFSLISYKDSVVKDIKVPDSILRFKENIKAYMNVGKSDSSLKKSKGKDSAKTKGIKDAAKLKKLDTARVKKPDTTRVKKADKKRTKRKIPGKKPHKDTIRQKIAIAKKIAINNSGKDSIKNIGRKDSARKQTSKEVAKKDSAKKKDTAKLALTKDSAKRKKDSIAKVVAAKKKIKRDPNSFEAIIPDSVLRDVRQRCLDNMNSMKGNMEMNLNSVIEQDRVLQKYKIEWHRKIALAIACLVLFMIGAPLGSIIRKGGLGTPMIFAIIFFMVFYFVSTRGEKLAKEEEMSAFTGMWLATFVLVPIGLFLIYKAMHDSNLFNKEFYSRLKRKIVKYYKKKKQVDHEE